MDTHMTYKHIYLDNAASTFPKPLSVINRMNNAMKYNTANPGRSGHRLSNQNAEIIYKARKTAADFFGITDSPENIVFTHSATHSINIAINGLIENGDSVIISDMEHNSVLRPLAEREKDGMITLKIAETSTSDDETVENFRKLIDAKTKMIFVTHASNVKGNTLPIEKIGKLCKDHGILFCVDSSQTAGHLKCDINSLGADILCTSGHKGLFGPQGTGLLVFSEKIPIKPLIFGGTGGSSLMKTQPFELPESLESGTQNTAGIAGLDEGIKFVRTHEKEIQAKEKKLYGLAFQGLFECKGITIYSDRYNKTPTLAFNIGDMPSEKVTEILDSKGICVRGGFHCAALFHEKMKTTKQGMVRASFSWFNTEEQIKLFVKNCRLISR